ncbi:hypothetical protein [Paraburkholderia sediminicola]|uniref:hypothetical protein n=1 Tax=Paraburkholderia sediminicola TaxID=458836 RepID=UPI0038BD9E89
MLSTLVPCRDVGRKLYVPPPWIRRIDSALYVISLLSFLPALGLFLTGLVLGNPVREALSRIGTSQLLPVVSYVQETLAPLKIVGDLARAQYPQFFGWLVSIPSSTIAHIFLASVGMGVGSLGFTCMIALVIAYRKNRPDWRDVASW